MTRPAPCLALAVLLAATATAPARSAATSAPGAPSTADDPCDGYKWDVRKERALFAGSAIPVSAGADARAAPVVAPNRLYRVHLMPQNRVSLATTAAKNAPSDAGFAGKVSLTVPAAGIYRISVDAPLWIDVLSGGVLMAVNDFQGQHGCRAPRKIVQFDLAARGGFVIQLSSSDEDQVRLTITASPARKL